MYLLTVTYGLDFVRIKLLVDELK